MKNHEVAELLNDIADVLEIKGDLVFKIRAYRKAALVIDSLSEDISEINKKGKLDDIPSIGEGLAKKIKEFLDTGHSKYFEELKKQTPVDVEELGKVEGLGPKTILKLYKKLKIENLKDLEKAAKKGKIQKIEGLGPGVEQNILKGIKFAKTASERQLLSYALLTAEEIKERLRKLKDVSKVEIAGSLRRRKETIGDVDILVSSKKPGNVMDFFTKMKDVERVLAHGPTKSTIQMHDLQVDLRIVDNNKFGSALLYFTGSKQHNIDLRKLAIKKGMKLSEYGVFLKKSNKLIASKTETDCYKKLGLKYIEPELRENEGEIESAKKNKLPKLIGYDDIKGDVQMHSNWSDGSNTIEEMALAAKKLDYQYICITDHIGTFKIANALDKKRIRKQRKEIDKINKKLKNFTILQGGEVNIKGDGTLDMKDSVLKNLDFVLAAIHSGFKNPKEQITNRIIQAMENENIDAIAHPTGRLINKRPAYELDFQKVFDAAKRTKTLMEIDSFPNRLDLNDVHAKAAIKVGVKLIIDTDAHDAEHLQFMRFGIATARRAGAEKKDVVNTKSLKEFLKILK
jgi:DNA polymerase (family 10)